jgi:uridine kinase
MIDTTDTSEILTVLRTREPRVVGIDGGDGSGKSSLASLLSRKLGWLNINLDDYVEKNIGCYMEHIHYDEVRNNFNDAGKPIIIEGVCLLAVLERLEQHLDILIYVKKMGGKWYDEDDCTVSEDDFINRKKEEQWKFSEIEANMYGKNPPSDVMLPELTEEIIRYHHKFRPYEKADIIYKRID